MLASAADAGFLLASVAAAAHFVYGGCWPLVDVFLAMVALEGEIVWPTFSGRFVGTRLMVSSLPVSSLCISAAETAFTN